MIHLTVAEILNLPPESNASFQVIHTTDMGMVMGVVLYMDHGWHTQSFYVSKTHPRYYEALAKVYNQ